MERNKGIDFIKCILPVLVIILHFNNSKGGAGMMLSSGNAVIHEVLLILEAISIGAVNMYMIISGYCLAKKKNRSITKIIILFFEVIIINCFFYCVNAGINKSFSLHDLIIHFIPINYFIWLYASCYIISLWFNPMLDTLNKNQFQFFLITLMLLFSIIPFLTDLYTNMTGNSLNGLSPISEGGSGAGYTVVQFCFCYILGVYLKKYPIQMSARKQTVLLGCALFSVYLNEHINFNTAIEYCNPFVIISSVLIISLATSLKYKKNWFFQRVSQYSFLLFLMHIKLYFIWKHDYYAYFLRETTIKGLLLLVFLITEMYIIALVLSVIYNYLEKKSIRKLLNNNYYLSLEGVKREQYE